MTNLTLVSNKKSPTSGNNVVSKTCAQVLVETLIDLGINSIFGYPGAAVLSIYNELAHKKDFIKHYLVRHEQAAVHSAEGYARISGQPGVVVVTSGPGFTNTITGIANAYADSTPLIILAGDVPSNDNKGKIFQKVDILSLTKSCCKKNFLVSSKDDIKQVIQQAYEVAMTGEKGPVVVALPRNILESKYIAKVKKQIYQKKSFKLLESDCEKVIKCLKKAKSPLILLGGGSIDSVDNIKTFVEKTEIPVVSTLMGIGAFSSKSNNYLGMIGINGVYCANTALNNADLIIALGVSFSDRTTCKNSKFGKNAKVFNINLKKNLHKNFYGIQVDVNHFLQCIMKKIDFEMELTSWQKQIQYFREESKPVAQKSTSLHSSVVLETIYELTKNYEPVVVTDVGQHQMLTAQFFNFDKPKKFITSGGLGTMGFGLPAAIGAQLANPNSLVLNITGDGSFQMNLQELATCREHNLPVKIIIMNNSYLGMVRQMQEKIYKNVYQVKMTNPDFKKIAEAYDLFAVRISSKDELIPTLVKAIEHKGTAIVDIMIDNYEEINSASSV